MDKKDTTAITIESDLIQNQVAMDVAFCNDTMGANIVDASQKIDNMESTGITDQITQESMNDKRKKKVRNCRRLFRLMCCYCISDKENKVSMILLTR